MASIVGVIAELIRIIVTVMRPISDMALDAIYRLFFGKQKMLPPIDDKILLISATELAEAIRKRKLRCEVIMRAYVARSRQVHSCINAAVGERYEDAIEEARAVDQLLATGTLSEEQLAKDTPLLGVPFSCKEAIGVKGLPQTAGIVSSKSHVAEADGAAPALYRKAGAIPYVVTSVPELLMWWESSNHVSGLTKSPYDSRRTVGGSSGGEGALITSAAALIGIGNDVAGSIRIPAAFCGIYGHKPSRSVINNWGSYPYCYKIQKDSRTVEFVSTGPMCRYARDLPLLTKVLSDNDARIPWDTTIDFRKMNVYYIESLPGFLHAAVPPVKAAVKKAAMHFGEKFGVSPTPLHIPELEYAFYIWECMFLEFGSPPFVSNLVDEGESINLPFELFRCILGLSDHTLPALYFAIVDRRAKDKFFHRCLEMCKTLQKKVDELFKDDAVLLVPTHPEPPPHYLMTIPKYPNISYTCIFNILGLPSTQIPAGLSGGLPIGLQAISGPLKDHVTIATALELDHVFQGWISPCPITV